MTQKLKKKKRRKRKRKVNYTELLTPPVPAENRCPHTLKAGITKSGCSQCASVQPRVIAKPAYNFWLIDEVDGWNGGGNGN